MADKQLNKEINKYIKEVKSFLICDLKTQKKFINDLKNRIYEHIDSGDINNAEDIYNQIGEPRKIVQGFFDYTDTRKIKRRMTLVKFIIIAVLIALLIWGIGVSAVVIDEVYHPGYFVEESYEIDSSGNEIVADR
ncbi:MAG: hypothetical protein LIO62_03165 [Clostridiales bacterium]|nr:hypothetical protein [Clostridiales bacterium]